MKVLMINGSPNEHGCTNKALTYVASALTEDGVDSEIVWLGKKPVQDCVGCRACGRLGHCVFTGDIVQELAQKAEAADGFVFGSPVYYAHPSGMILSVLDRLFYSAGSCFAHKPGAAIVSARRAGTTASVDVLNKYFTISQMPVVSSTYWNMVHGARPEDVEQDLEGIQTMRNIGHNMAWLLKCIQLGKESGVCPASEHGVWTNFIR